MKANFTHNRLLSPLLYIFHQPLLPNPHIKFNCPWEYTQSPAIFNTTSLPSMRDNHQPKPPTEPYNHKSMSSRHVKSFSILRIDLLNCISVTFATFHVLRSPLKAEAHSNTVPGKEGLRTLINILETAQRRQAFFKLYHSTNPFNYNSMLTSRQVIPKYNNRLTTIHRYNFHLLATNPNSRVNPPITITIASVHVTSMHSPLYVFTYPTP
jgi:hypothetical protein